MKSFLLYSVALIILTSCAEQQKPVTHTADYESFLTFKKVSTYSLEADMAFWQERLNRMPKDEASKRKLAGLHAANFKRTGRVEELHYADSIYHSLLETTSSAKAGLYLGLAQNSITQHQFRIAQKYAEAALAEGGNEASSLLVITDIALELGDQYKAKSTLKKFTNKNSFAHLIRQVKVNDHEGELDSAILKMEKAFDRVKGNKDLYCWSLSNLGDMYGHAGRIEDAYKAYLSVLQKDPGYDYVLKGIAWIALSNDKNYSDAKRIIHILASRSRMPDAHLMLAKIAELENDDQEKSNQLNLFVSLTDNEQYKTMYAKYLAEIYAEDLHKPDLSLAIAEEEIKNRPTPQSYDLKAWALLHLGRKKEALFVAQKFVTGKTFEPSSAYHVGMIYLANNFEIDAEKYLEQALESSFELGPIITRDIEQALEKI